MADLNSNLKFQQNKRIQDNKGDTEEDESRLPLLVQQLRQKLEGREVCSGHLRISDDSFLSMFLRVKNYELDRALQAVEKYYNHFESFPELLTGIQASVRYKPVYDSKILVRLREKCKQGSAVYWLCVDRWDVSKYNVLTVRQANLFAVQEAIQSPQVQLLGCTVILDLKNFSIAHLRQFRPADIKFAIQSCQDGLPLRVVAVHIVNYPTIFHGLYYIAYQFMKKKLRNRIHWHKDTKSLHEHLDKESLPMCLGGTREMEDVEDRSIVSKLVRNDLQYTDYYM